MAFDLARELSKIHHQLGQTRALIQQNAESLRKEGDFGPRCQILADRVEKLAAQLPPPEPTPPVTEWEVEIPFVKLVKHRKLLRIRWLFADDSKPDRNGLIPVTVKRTVKVKLRDPRYPGSPAVRQKVLVDSTEAVVEEGEDEAEADGGFVYEIRAVKIEKTIEMPAIPPDAPPTPIQAAYLARRAELEAEVRDLETFIAEIGREVNESLAASLALKGNVEALVKRVDDLPMPADAAAEMHRIRERFEEIQKSLPDLTGEMAAASKRLGELKEQAREICPEWIP